MSSRVIALLLTASASMSDALFQSAAGFSFDSDSEDEHPPLDCSMFFADEDDSCVPGVGSASDSRPAPTLEFTPRARPLPARAAAQSTGQGKYDRTATSARRLSHAQYAWDHKQQAEENRIGVPCSDSCPFDRKCGRNFTPATLVAAHERVYGTGVQCVDGVAICRVTEAYTHKAWRMLILSWVTRRADDPSTAPTEKFTVEGQGPVCSDFCRAAYFGLDTRCKDGFAHTSAYKKYMAGARRGTLLADERIERAEDSSCFDTLTNRPGPDGFAKQECIGWWIAWLRIEDQAPNDPVIMHRRVPMNQIYSLEYCADMRWWGTSGRVLSRERWTYYKKDALSELSVEYFGQVLIACLTPTCLPTPSLSPMQCPPTTHTHLDARHRCPTVTNRMCGSVSLSGRFVWLEGASVYLCRCCHWQSVRSMRTLASATRVL